MRRPKNLRAPSAQTRDRDGTEPRSPREVFATLFDQEAARIYRFVLSRCGSTELAEDVTSQVFVNAATCFADGRGADVSPQWLTTVARSRLIDHWRRSQRERIKVTRFANDQVSQQPIDSNERTDHALDSLSVRPRAALTLRYMDGFSVAEVSDALGVSYRAAESLLSRARSSFRQAYQEVDHGPR